MKKVRTLFISIALGSMFISSGCSFLKSEHHEAVVYKRINSMDGEFVLYQFKSSEQLKKFIALMPQYRGRNEMGMPDYRPHERYKQLSEGGVRIHTEDFNKEPMKGNVPEGEIILVKDSSQALGNLKKENGRIRAQYLDDWQPFPPNPYGTQEVYFEKDAHK